MGYNIIKTVKKETERIKKKEKNIEHSLPIRIRNISYCFRTRCHIAGVNPRRPAHCRRKTASPRGELRRNRSTPGIGGNSPENAAQSAARSDAGAFADFASQWSSSWNPAKAPTRSRRQICPGTKHLSPFFGAASLPFAPERESRKRHGKNDHPSFRHDHFLFAAILSRRSEMFSMRRGFRRIPVNGAGSVFLLISTSAVRA